MPSSMTRADRMDRLIALQRAVGIAQAQSGTFEQAANEEIPQDVIMWLYDERMIAAADDHTGERWVYATPRGERLLAAYLRGLA